MVRGTAGSGKNKMKNMKTTKLSWISSLIRRCARGGYSKKGENLFADKNIDFKYKKEINEGKGFYRTKNNNERVK